MLLVTAAVAAVIVVGGVVNYESMFVASLHSFLIIDIQ